MWPAHVAGAPGARLDRAAIDLATPDSERLTEQHRAQTLHVLRDLFKTLEDRLRHMLGLALAGVSGAGREAVAALASDGRQIVWPRVEAAVLAPPFDLLDAALTRAAEHAIAAPRRAFASGDSALAELLGRQPDSPLTQRAMNLVIAESRRQDEFGEPRLPLGELDEGAASRAAWLAGAALRAFVTHGYPIDGEVLDRAIEDAVRTLLAERGGEDAMGQAAALIRRLDALDMVDDALLTALAEEGRMLPLAAALAGRARIAAPLTLRLLVARDGVGLAILARALDLSQPLVAALSALAPREGPAAVGSLNEMSPADAKRKLGEWRRDPAFAVAITAVRG